MRRFYFFLVTLVLFLILFLAVIYFFFSCLSAFLFVTVLQLLWRQADTKFSSAALLYRHTAFCGFVVLPEKGRFLKYLLLYFFFLFFCVCVISENCRISFLFLQSLSRFSLKVLFFFGSAFFFVCSCADDVYASLTQPCSRLVSALLLARVC